MKTLACIIRVGAVCTLVCGPRFAHAQTCDAPPLFDLSGPACSTARQAKQCGCSECFAWTAAEGATWYEVRRCDRSGANCTIVGDTHWKNRAAYTDRNGVVHPAFESTLWCAAWDNPFPRVSSSYDYTVRACTDGPSGPLCSAQFSNSVNYVAAPYMCIDHGVEIACALTTPPASGYASDTDGDGIIDAIDLDDDGDGIPDLKDNCPLTINIGQRDGDGDGVGDACDLDPSAPGSPPSDADRDGVGDRVDVCPWTYDPQQADTDGDGIGDACDNCPAASNVMQTDGDADGQGDLCDLDDGTIFAVWSSRSRLTWAPEAGFTTWCVYRGDLSELKRSRTYTQLPGSNTIAARTCALAVARLDDAASPAPGRTAFYLVAGRPDTSQPDLGVDGAGLPRPNANPCP